MDLPEPAGPAGVAVEPVDLRGRLSVDLDPYRVTAGGTPVECTRGEFAILAAMAGKSGRVFTAVSCSRPRGIDRDSTERTIDLHVMNLRRRIESDLRRAACRFSAFLSLATRLAWACRRLLGVVSSVSSH
jgi:two-component system response regulator MtrA